MGIIVGVVGIISSAAAAAAAAARACSVMQLTADVFSTSIFTLIISLAPQLLITQTTNARHMPSAMPPCLKPKGTDKRPSPQNVLRIEK